MISWHREFRKFDYCLALDYRKAFDSMDYILPILVMQQIGVPVQLCNLIRYQWDNHKRWCSFNGTVHPQTLVTSKGIPQGDSWSPIALSLALSILFNRTKCPMPPVPKPGCTLIPYHPCAQHARSYARIPTLAVAGGCHAHAHQCAKNPTHRSFLGRIRRSQTTLGGESGTRKFRALLVSFVLTSKASWGRGLNDISPTNGVLDKAYKIAVHHP